MHCSARSRLIGVALIASLSGCATLHPAIPAWTAADIQRAHSDDPLRVVTEQEIDEKLGGIRNLLGAAAGDREALEINAAEVQFYGALIAAIGGVIESPAAINAGSGTAALSSVFSSRYKLSAQSSVFRKAERRIECFEDAWFAVKVLPDNSLEKANRGRQPVALSDIRPLAPVSDEGAEALRNRVAAKLSVSVASAPLATTQAIRRVLGDLHIALQGVALTPLSREQIAASLKKEVDDREDVAKSTSALMLATGMVANDDVPAALGAKAAYPAALDACLIQFPQ